MKRTREEVGTAHPTLKPATMVAATLVLLGASLPVPAVGAVRASAPPDRAFVVVAVVDTGINPYHLEFRRPEMTAHPSTFIEGFPRAARRLELSFGAETQSDAVARDRTEWAGIKTGELVWIPGTNIIGAIDARGYQEGFLDTAGHGTGVASLAAGRTYGPPSNDILVVAVKGFEDGLEWAARQPWIDIITNSWSALDAEPVERGSASMSRDAVASGKVVCFASGNLAAPLWTLGEQGPSWNVNVGAASRDRTERHYTGWPNDVLGIADGPAAAPDSFDGKVDFGGTSAATPRVCGLMAAALATVRSRSDDPVQGPHRGALVRSAPAGRGPLADGALTNHELVDALQATATPAGGDVDPTDPTIPALPVAPWIRGGYGIVDTSSLRRALAVIHGHEPRPDRAMEDAWIQTTDTIRNLIWGEPPDAARR